MKTEALDTLAEWRDEVHKAVMDDRPDSVRREQIHLWFALVGMRNAMDKVLVEAGYESFMETATV